MSYSAEALGTLQENVVVDGVKGRTQVEEDEDDGLALVDGSQQVAGDSDECSLSAVLHGHGTPTASAPASHFLGRAAVDGPPPPYQKSAARILNKHAVKDRATCQMLFLFLSKLTKHAAPGRPPNSCLKAAHLN